MTVSNENTPVSVLQLLCLANQKIDAIARAEKRHPVAPLPKIKIGHPQHHVVALAGLLQRTTLHGITFQEGKVIVEVRRV